MNRLFPLCLVLAFLLGLSPKVGGVPEATPAKETGPYIVDEGGFPGVTWADDIHPIFIRNACRLCHTRGKEFYVDKLNKFALGLIDPEDPQDPYHSYHELVYSEGKPEMEAGEELRDGQCCWPSGYPEAKQRRIWAGHAERSVVSRKLERDYFDWDRPPRFVEEGLRLTWGLPMPWARPESGLSEARGHIVVRGYLRQALIYLKLWLGVGEAEVVRLPPRIPAKDRALLRYWINHAMELEGEETELEIQVTDGAGGHAGGSVVYLVGNFNNSERREVYDRLALKADGSGRASIKFPKGSVVTSFWFVSSEKDGAASPYQPIGITDGVKKTLVLKLGAGRGEASTP